MALIQDDVVLRLSGDAYSPSYGVLFRFARVNLENGRVTVSGDKWRSCRDYMMNQLVGNHLFAKAPVQFLVAIDPGENERFERNLAMLENLEREHKLRRSRIYRTDSANVYAIVSYSTQWLRGIPLMWLYTGILRGCNECDLSRVETKSIGEFLRHVDSDAELYVYSDISNYVESGVVSPWLSPKLFPKKTSGTEATTQLVNAMLEHRTKIFTKKDVVTRYGSSKGMRSLLYNVFSSGRRPMHPSANEPYTDLIKQADALREVMLR